MILGDLAGSVGDIVSSVLGDVINTILGQRPLAKLANQDESDFKQYSDAVPDIRQWSTIPNDTSSPSYFFLLKYNDKVIQIPFNINPQHETISEPQASTTVHTQGGGKVIHSEGCISKEISISGLTGLYPGEKRKRLPDSGIGSGFEGFQLLQNVFRRYAFLKRYGDVAKGLELIYVNRRRQESWVVEPRSFSSEDATEHNFMFSYNIVLETLYPYNGRDTQGLAERLLNSIPGYQLLDTVTQRIVETVDSVNAAAGKISAIVNGFTNTILKPIIALANSYADVKGGRLPNLANFKRDLIKNYVKNLKEVQFALEAAGDPENAEKVAKLQRHTTESLNLSGIFDKHPSTNANSVVAIQKNQSSNFLTSDGVAVSSIDAQNAGQVTVRPDAELMLGGNSPGPSALPGTATLQQQQADAAQALTQTQSSVGGSALDPNGSFQINRFSGVNADSQALPPSSSQLISQLAWNAEINRSLASINPANADFKSDRVHYGDSIQTLSNRLLQDPARWEELVFLNNLKYPYLAEPAYISEHKLSNVLAYGDTILYPAPKSSANPKTRVWRNETFESLSLSPFERSLGNDIFIDEKTNDIQWTANDIALVYGVNNVKQFVRKRVVTKRGSLRRSLRFGYSTFIGESVGAYISILKAETQSLFSDDDRITSAQALSVNKVEQGLTLGLAITVRNNQDPILITASI